MIQMLDGFPPNVVAFMAEGRVTRKDYEDVLIPRIDQALQAHAKIRLYYEIGASFFGMDADAAWEDFRLGLEHLSRWERIAVVTEVGWIRLAVGAFRFLMPGQLRVFGTGETSHARAWIMAD